MRGEELVQLGGRMIGDAAQYVGRPGLWIDAVEFCRSDEGVDRGSTLTAPVESANNHARRPRAIGRIARSTVLDSI